jgi:hypothetical protein
MYGTDTTKKLRDIQMNYLKDCDLLDAKNWSGRPVMAQYLDRAVALLSPLL